MEENEIEIESVVVESTAESVPLMEVEKPHGITEEKTEKLVRFPLTRVKHLVKMDPDVHLCSQEALFLISKATVPIAIFKNTLWYVTKSLELQELFVECLAVESYTFTAQAKKKTVQKRDVEQCIEAVDALVFLEGVID